MGKSTEQEVDYLGIIEGIRPDAPPPLVPAKEERREVDEGEQKSEPDSEVKERRRPRPKPSHKEHGTKEPPEADSVEAFFLSHFIDTPSMKTVARKGKMVYIRPEYHERIQRIISVIGNNEVNISTYIDNVLVHHFNEFEEPIRKLYNRNYHDVY